MIQVSSIVHTNVTQSMAGTRDSVNNGEVKSPGKAQVETPKTLMRCRA